MFGGMANGAGPDQPIGGNLGMANGVEEGFQGNNAMEGGGGGGGGPRDVPAGPRPAGGGRNRMDSEFIEGKLFLGGLDNATTRETLLEYVSQWGEVNDYVLMPGRGFGFVTYADAAAAQAFLEHREHIIDGKKVEAKAAVPKNSSSGNSLTKKMFVGGTGDIDDDTFRQYFEQFGDIDDCVILRKPDGGSRGFGFVTYKDEMSVEKCLVMQHSLNGRSVELKRAIRKEDMAPGSSSNNFGGGGGYTGGGNYGGGSGGGSGGPMRGGKQPDWTCPACKNKNFGWRELCNRCGINKPMGGQMSGGRGGNGPMGGGYGQQRFDGPIAPMAPMGSMGMAPMGNMGMGQMGGMGMAPMGGMGMGMAPMGGYGMGQMGGMGYGMGMGMAPMGMYGQQSGYGAPVQQAPQQQQQQQGGYGRSGGGGGRGGGAQRYRPY